MNQFFSFVNDFIDVDDDLRKRLQKYEEKIDSFIFRLIDKVRMVNFGIEIFDVFFDSILVFKQCLKYLKEKL